MLQLKQSLLVEQEQPETTESFRSILLKTPSVLDQTDENVIEVADALLPFSVGFEVECFMADEENFPFLAFSTIPNILHVNCDKSEQRFRIPSGIKGLLCLEQITKLLKERSLLDPSSGIHYHVDCTDCYHLFNKSIINDNASWILLELDTWNYKGTYNARRCEFSSTRYWTRFKSGIKTMEFRIGEMTFDYTTILTRMSHACDIVNKLKIKAIEKYETNDVPLLRYHRENVNKILKTRTERI